MLLHRPHAGAAVAARRGNLPPISRRFDGAPFGRSEPRCACFRERSDSEFGQRSARGSLHATPVWEDSQVTGKQQRAGERSAERSSQTMELLIRGAIGPSVLLPGGVACIALALSARAYDFLIIGITMTVGGAVITPIWVAELRSWRRQRSRAAKK